MNNTTLPELSDDKRLQVFKMLTAACGHLYSKGQLQQDKFNIVAPVFAEITKHDPIFMAHFNVWTAKNDNKDLKVLSTYFGALNDADGSPFFKGSKKNKPNLRQVSYSVLQTFDPHIALRVNELAHIKFGVPGLFNNATHFPTGLNTAFKKYLKYREANPEILQGARKAGLSEKLRQIYRLSHAAPSDEAAAILSWPQKDGRKIKLQKLPDFSKMSGDEIVKELESSKLSPQVALSVLPQDKITAKVAKVLLGNATGNQSLILYNWFAKNGFLEVAAIKSLFKDKAQTATTAVDRIDTLTRNSSAEDKKEMSQVRSIRRKTQSQSSLIGKLYMHIDKSSSMSGAIEFAKDKASVFAECVNDPGSNFRWGLFGTKGQELALPAGFTKEDFHSTLYGVRASDGSTDCIALYKNAREFGAEVDVYVTDQGHNVGNVQSRIEAFHSKNPSLPKPKAAVIVGFGANTSLETSLKAVGIPTVSIKPEVLSESALVAQSIRNALVGELAVIEEIMETPLPELPKWWNQI